MISSYKFRLYPTKQQQEMFAQHFGCVRWVYNWGLAKQIEHFDATGTKLSGFDLIRQLTPLKKQLETVWLREVYAGSLISSLMNLDCAYTAFFRKNAKFPKFKSKNDNYQSFQYPQGVKVDKINHLIKLPKIGSVKAVLHREFDGKIKTCTLSKTPNGQYFISILIDNGEDLPQKSKRVKNSEVIGIDVGLKTFVTTSRGDRFESPKFLSKKLKKLKRLQRKMSRKKKGSKNRNKARLRLARQYQKVTNCRQDFLHKLSNRIVSENQTKMICVENLNIQDLIEKTNIKNIRRSYSDVAIGTFLRFLEYKCERQGKHFVKIGRFDPSSKICNVCGKINQNLQLTEREWACSCGTHHDRDVNAAINIVKFGKKIGLDKPKFTLTETSVRKSKK